MSFDVPEECCMAVELLQGVFNGVRGIICNPEAFLHNNYQDYDT